MKTTQTISKLAFTRALSLARAHGHAWTCHTEHPAVAAILAGPEPYDARALAEAFEWAAAEDDSRRPAGVGFSLSHTTGSGRLSWDIADDQDAFRPSGTVRLTVSRPSLAWRVWAAQRDAAAALVETDPMVGRELARMLPPEPERGSVDVLSMHIPAGVARIPVWREEPRYDDVSPRHLATITNAAHALGGSDMLADVFGQLGEFHGRMRSSDLMAAGIVMSQEIGAAGRVITLDLWGYAKLDIRLIGGRHDESLVYDDTAIWSSDGWREDFLGMIATAPFVERIVDRLMSWAGMPLERACQIAELALDEVGTPAKVVGIEAGGAWHLKVERIAAPAEDLPEGHFSSET